MVSREALVSHNNVEMPLVSIIILNYNGMEHLKDCLDSVKRLVYPNFETILVDNASTDGSVNFVKDNYPWVKVIQNKQNLGFAGGNNVGIKAAKGKYIFLLNPDTEVDPFCLNNLMQVIDTNEKVGICGAKIRLFDERNRLQHAGGRYHVVGVALDRGFYEVDLGQHDKLNNVSFVCGAAFLLRKSILSKTGLFDPVFFIYHEDVDFCLRTWLCGFQVLYVPNAVIYHKSAYVVNLKTGKRQPLVEFHKNKNTLLILMKNFENFTVIKWLPVTICYRLFWFLSYLANHNLPCAYGVIASFIWTIKNMRYIILARRKIMQIKKETRINLHKHCADISEVWLEFKKLSQLKSKFKRTKKPNISNKNIKKVIICRRFHLKNCR